MIYPETLQKVISGLKQLPGIGEKTAERMAFSLLKFNDEQIFALSNGIKNIHTKVKKCSICGMLTEKNVCDICTDKNRNKNIICVVEDAKDAFLFEQIGNYNGLYHILDGLISPIDGIDPMDLNIESLKKRIKTKNVSEIILALKFGIEGETTSLYIKKIIEPTGIKITKLATGIPAGADMDYLDALTLDSALQNRKQI